MFIKYFTDEEGLERIVAGDSLWVWPDENIDYGIDCPIYITQKTIKNYIDYDYVDHSIMVFAEDCIVEASNHILNINK